MGPVEGKDKRNENVMDISEGPSTSSQEKVTFKRKILNPFKRLSLRRSKSNSQRYSLIKSESEFIIQKDQHIDNKQPKYNQSQVPESRLAYRDNNPFRSETSVPLAACTAQTIQSLVIFPNDRSDQRNFESTHILDNKTLNLIFNPADLPSLSDYNKYNHASAFKSNNDSFETKSSQTYKIDSQKVKRTVNELCNFVPSTFIPNDNSFSTNFNLRLKEILSLIYYLQESESHLKLLFSKYIQDENLEKELLDAVSGHAKIQIENERRANKLAQEMLLQERDTLKAREDVLKNSLEVVVQINRLFEEEIATLKSENEKIVVDYDNESPSCAYHKRYEADILKSNNELRARVKYLLNETKKLEEELKNSAKENECLINQIATANTQNRTYRDILRRAMGDHEVENAALLHQISNYEQILKASTDAGDILMEDLEAIKRQLKPLPFAINWSKFKCRGSTVVDLLHLARSCLNELSRELVNNYMQISVRTKDSETQNMEILKLNQEIHRFKTNDLQLQSKLEDLSALQIQLQVQEQKTNLIKSELDMYKKENSIMTERFYQEKNLVDNLNKDLNAMTFQISAKDLEIVEINKKMDDVITENSTLKCHIDSLKKLLEESKITKILSDLLETQEKCAYFQAQYHLIQLEKNNLIDQSKKFESERENLLKYQQTYNDHLQLQNSNISELTRQNEELKEKLKQEQINLSETSEQLFQKTQESNIMKTVQSQFTSEITKNEALQSKALSENFEMNRLTVVAEYNNLISQQLKNAVDSKDKIILELKSNMDILYNSEKKNFEEKSELCRELVEASCVIKQLKNDLNSQNETIQRLCNERTMEQEETNKKVIELHKMLIEERQATHELINDHKNLTVQRDNLLSQQKENIEKLEKIENMNKDSRLLQEKLQNKCDKYEVQLQIVTKELQEANKKIELNYQKVRNDAVEYENKLSARDHTIDKLKAEKEALTNTVKYLQNNVQKLHSDLDVLRKQEKEYKEKLASNSESLSKFQQCTDNQQKVLEQCSEEQKLLEQKLNEALLCNNDLLSEYNSLLKDARIKEENLQKELQTYKKLNETKAKSIENLARDSKEKLKLLELRQSEYDALKEQLQNYEELKKDLDDKSKLLEKCLNNEQELNAKLFKLLPENEKYQKKIEKSSDVIKLLQNQLNLSTKSREKEIETCQSFINNIISEVKQHKDDMSKDLQTLSSKYSEKSLMYEKLKGKFKNLNDLLINTIGALEEERILREQKETEIHLLKKQLKDLKEYSNNFTKELNELNARTITEFGDNFQNELEETRQLYTTAKVECKTLEIQLKETTEKLNRLEQYTEIEGKHILKELECKSDLLQQYQKNLEVLENQIKRLRLQSQSANESIAILRSEISQLYQKVQMLEFQKCELTLRYHELNGKYLSEKNLNASLKESQESQLAPICELTEHAVEKQTSMSNALMLTSK